MSLISQGLGAVWSVIYLTENMSEDGQAKLFPFAIYPQTEKKSFVELPPIDLAEIWRESQSSFITRLLPDNLTERFAMEGADSSQPQPAESKQLILPLIHQETFIGLLVTGREDRQWQKAEAQQIEEIARTISLARFIEFQYHWTQDELAIQSNLRRIEHDRLDNLLHQLKNPLTALRTFSKLLVKRLLPEDSNGKIVKSILSQSDRFQELLEQFEAESRALSKTEPTENAGLPLLAAEQEIDRSSFLLPSSSTELSSVDLRGIVAPLLDTARAIALERKIELIDNLPEEIPLIKGDLAALREILNNLIDNALKYTMAGGRVQLDLLTNRNNMLGIAIRDSGVGIPPSDRQRIFERHYRGVQAKGEIPGTGLGLAIARELATKMQGEIELISPNNLLADRAGTTVILWLFTAIGEQRTVINKQWL